MITITMLEPMQIATHSLSQQGDRIQTKNATHPPAVHDMTHVNNTNTRARAF